MAATNDPVASVIIPVYNDGDGLARCVACLGRQTVPGERFEIIVIDNGSTPPVERPQDDGNLRVVREPRPGSYAARNKGLEIARGGIIAFTDADCRPREDWIARGIAAVERFNGIGSIGGRIEVVCRDPARPRPAELYEKALVLVQQDLVEHRGFAATANMWTRRETLDRIGPFEAMLLSGGDAEWGRRLRAVGGLVLYDDELVVEHPARATIADLYRKLRRVRSSPLAGILREADAQGPPPPRRSAGAKMRRFLRRTEGWNRRDRAAALAVATLMELAGPLAELDLKLQKRQQ